MKTLATTIPSPPDIITQIRLRLRNRIRPFPPFALESADGRRRKVPQPGTLAVADDRVLYFDRHDQIFSVPATEIRAIIDLPIPSPRKRARKNPDR